MNTDNSEQEEGRLGNGEQNTGIPTGKVEAHLGVNAAPSCKDCRVGRGYRPFLDYVELCPLHAAAPALYAELVKLRDTFNDFILPLKIMRRGLMAEACEIARDSANTALALAHGQVASEQKEQAND